MWQLLLVSAACLASVMDPEGLDEPTAKADDQAYTQTLEKRASEVLDELRIGDQDIEGRVRAILINQYRGLRALHDALDAKVKDIQSRGDFDKTKQIESERASTEAAASSLNDRFLATLAGQLTPMQVETVKDKMTYHKLQVTYKGYLEMLPQLTVAQKQVIFDTLKQARDRATYAGSAEAKTAIFNRYKGRVNNYLSSEGYDLKLAAKEWAERRKNAR